MEKMRLKIEPLDPLFFRDGRPFTMGEDDWAGNLFPPPPGVIYGALRSLYFSCHPEELHRANTPEDPTRNLRINLIYWLVDFGGDEGRACFPMPMDCVKVKRRRKDGLPYRLLSLYQPENVVTNSPLSWLLWSPLGAGEVETLEDGLLDEHALAEYLQGKREEFEALRLDDWIRDEYKVGIARDRCTLSAEEHRLYHIKMVRFCGLSLAVEYEGLDLPPEGIMRFGGEGRPVRYTHLHEETVSWPVPREGRFFKLYLVTPAFFKGGWLPGWIKDGIGRYGSLRLRLLAAAVGRPRSIGGFDMQQKRPKEMHRAVPAGSVYYFEILEGSMAEAVGAFHGRSVSEYRAEEGFGIALVGCLSSTALGCLERKGGD